MYKSKKRNKIVGNKKVKLKGKAGTFWFTGLPCSGKTTIAGTFKKELEKKGCCIVHLDGDDIRSALNSDLGFSEEDKQENLRRVAHIAELFNKNGIYVAASFISPTDKLRNLIRKIVGDIKIIYVKCELSECEKRDTKGMYRRARNGDIPNFIGISAPFQAPARADVIVDTQKNNVAECVKDILDGIKIEEYSTLSRGSKI